MSKNQTIADRYRQYEAEKANLPKGLTAREYETAIRNLTKKYKI